MGGACSTYGGEERCILVLEGKPEGKKPLGRPRLRWEDNIEIDHQEVRWDRGLDLSGSLWGQVACFCKHGNELSGSIKCGVFHD